MTVFVFAGPTISAAEGEAHLSAVFLPPAAQGDLYRAALEKPAAIGLIDGYFERIPSVAHKEILWAMAQGVHVFGAASMGALRAAELSLFGMEGVGAIFEGYLRGELEADDEVAVAHAAVEDDYRPLSEALVNVRATLRAAVRAGVIVEELRVQLEGIAARAFYADRCYPLLFEQAAQEGADPDALAALRTFLVEGRVDQKRLDALALLRVMRERFTEKVAPKRVRYHFEPTDAWELIRESATHRVFEAGVCAVDPAVEALMRQGGKRYAAARRGALGRALSLEAARRQNVASEGAVLTVAVESLCREHGLRSLSELRGWLAAQEVEEVDQFLKEEAQVRWAALLYGQDTDRCLADHLRATGEYAGLRAGVVEGGVDVGAGETQGLKAVTEDGR
ncbi:TfuA-like protein [Chondromyces crocatus]|uniref:TfuA-like core domain-containing protein n=1 Tax=Chondromyces crocatus TaxID=52 RepID=A0A0K1EGL8_CHOCO|nr:TfuA-like protein [Chondromyces crocatus]AKT39994.1 uncharacterized protein CMC5_041470 [Chondromyces crocatus]